MCFKRLFRQGIQFSGSHMGFKLLIPRLGIKHSKPLAKGRKFLCRERLYLLLYFFQLAHFDLPGLIPGFKYSKSFERIERGAVPK